MKKKHAVVCLKSFGDMTIAARALRMLYEEDALAVSLLVGSHHLELCKALRPSCDIEVIQLKSPGVPAFYDIKDRGVIQVIFSLFDAYKTFHAYELNSTVLIFDSITLRERILARGRKSMALSNHNNIYRNYRETFLQTFGRVKEEVVNPGSGKVVLICPHGRKSFRNIPADLVDSMASMCIAHGFDPAIYMLDGEAPIPCKVPRVVDAKRSFAHLRQSIEQACAVISADSLTAHLSAYVTRPVFIASPYLKTKFWLPPNTDENQYWGLFSEPKKTLIALDNFLSSLK
jgi:hypothetical protein